MTAPSDLQSLVQDYLSTAPAGRRAAFAGLLKGLRDDVAACRYDVVGEALRQVISGTLDFTEALKLHRVSRDLRAGVARPPSLIRLAVLGSITTQQLATLVDLFLFGSGVWVDIYESAYGTCRQEILDERSPLYAFEPPFVYLPTTWRDLSGMPAVGDDETQVRALADRELADRMALWTTVHGRLRCQVVQDNLVVPPWRPLDNYESRHPASGCSYVTEINRRLAAQAPSFVTIHDVDHLAGAVGRYAWADERFYCHAKLPCSPEHLVPYAHSVASVIAAHAGHSRKCLVLDLDNTLWGGVVGDAGMEGLQLGVGDPVAEAFLGFQRYVKALRERGVVLAVCSKNDAAVAERVFREHPHMVLRLDDIACFVANWSDKAANIRAIAQNLNLGLDSFVFIDDSPHERALVRRILPDVAVPEMPADPAAWVEALDRGHFFQAVTVGADDLRRTADYRASAQRQALAASARSVEEFLDSLQMSAAAAPITSATLGRSVQLINRSNQFNLRTRRYSPAHVATLLTDGDWLTLAVTLSDRLGDSGLIAVVLGQIRGLELFVDTWVMSCRVLKRTVEEFTLIRLYEAARARGLRAVVGEYLPTAKNALVKAHYANLGFTLVSGNDVSGTVWEMPISESWTAPRTFIKEVSNDG